MRQTTKDLLLHLIRPIRIVRLLWQKVITKKNTWIRLLFLATKEMVFYVLRYADVLLLLAEALNEVGYNGSGGPGTAFYYLNRIRERAGLSDKTSADLPDQASFENWIFNERRVELALENDRWFDIARNPNGVAILQAYLLSDYNLSTPVLTPNDLLFPIPQSEINVHNNSATFPQNPQ